jgi:hypothetical protein
VPHKIVVNEAQGRGLITFCREDQLKAVEELVKLLSTDPPMAMVARLITTFNKVVMCKHKPMEYLKIFVNRLCGLAVDHIVHAGVSSSKSNSRDSGHYPFLQCVSAGRNTHSC